ncbi:MAG: 4Fe-4S binding protein [Caldilineaceae bacterium]|nr:4Fe-4S binding protein [Caldilineaceae bacterium]
MSKQLPLRQRVRKGLILTMFLLFPLILYYFSPALIIEGAAQGIITGSFIMFGLMFVSSLFVGRLWCGWACPGAGLQEMFAGVNNQTVRSRWAGRVKWIIWTPWILGIAAAALSAGGLHQVDPFFRTVGGVSVAEPASYIVYYGVVAIFVVLALTVGRRGGCHVICWMAPFMILGRQIRNRFGWASLQLTADADRCVDCTRCSTNCPMSLDVHKMVQTSNMEHPDCVLCGTCVDNCKKGVIRFNFAPVRRTADQTQRQVITLS